jgi:hypothetical protein
MDLDIEHDIESNRFVAETEHGEATLEYSRADQDTLDYTSTFVPEEDRGSGVGEALVLHALDWAEENDFQVIATCPFVRHVLEEHPERSSVVTG